MTPFSTARTEAETYDEGLGRMTRDRDMTRRGRAVRDERGQGAVVLLVVILVVVAAVIMLIRTNQLASSIHSKTARIAETGRGINVATDAIFQLETTKTLGQKILKTSEPLVPDLATIVETAASIDRLATSINGTALAVNNTARGINSTASGILTTGQSINRGVEQINRNVDTAIEIARKIKADTGNILNEAGVASNQLSCIDQALAKATDEHCR